MIEVNDLIRTARLLRSEHGENPEYDRALVEIVMGLTARTEDDRAETRRLLNMDDVPSPMVAHTCMVGSDGDTLTLEINGLSYSLTSGQTEGLYETLGSFLTYGPEGSA